jgi:hypothetical protein
MNLKSALFKTLLGIAIVLFIPVALYFWMVDPWHISAPKDQKLITIFHNHRAAFEKLREMAAEDIKQRKASFFSESYIEGNLDEIRKAEYRHLISEIYSGLVLAIDYDGAVIFTFAHGGLSAISPGWMKGIEYVPGDYRRRGKIVDDLDHGYLLKPNGYLREIEPKWFIAYQRTDD